MQFEVVPYVLQGDLLEVVTANLFEPHLEERLEGLTGRQIQLLVSTPTAIRETLKRSEGTAQVLQRWEELKQEEKGKGEEHSVLDGVPAALPAVQQADTYSRRAARVGFDWAEPDGVADKVREEIAEVEAATTPEEREAELGDLLFAVINWARWLKVDPETALRQANARFAHRFRGVERIAREQGLDMKTLTIDELEALWQNAKLYDE